MVDTIDVFYDFPSRKEYNLCYEAIDKMSRQKSGQAIHKANKKAVYLTTAFAKIGILQISLRKTQFRRACYILLHPIRLLHPNSHLLLSHKEDYPEICRRLNVFLSSINQIAQENILPPIELWHVARIDYAFDIETPFVSEYIHLFKAGHIPAGFSRPEDYETSAYLKAKHGNINFYDKLVQVRQEYDLSDENIAGELHHMPEGLLRIEFQCHNPYVIYMKQRYGLPDSTFQYLFDADIAQLELQRRVQSLIGKRDFFPCALCVDAIGQRHKHKTFFACCYILHQLMETPGLCLTDLKKSYPQKKKQNRFDQLLCSIRKVGVNPIPIEVAYRDTNEAPNTFFLANPYNLIQCSR